MKIKLRTTQAGPLGAHHAGAIVDFERTRAYDLIERGYAEQIDDPAETAMLAQEETATAKPQRRK